MNIINVFFCIVIPQALHFSLLLLILLRQFWLIKISIGLLPSHVHHCFFFRSEGTVGPNSPRAINLSQLSCVLFV
jgi:hypothetical protein